MSDSGVNPRVVARSSGLLIGDLFRHEAAAHPERIALKDRHRALSYADFARRPIGKGCAQESSCRSAARRVAWRGIIRGRFVQRVFR